MKSPNQTADDLGTLTEAWNRLAPNDQFAGLTLVQFQAVIQPSLDARTQLAQNDLDYQHQITTRMAADETTNEAYKRVVFGIRSHPNYGSNSGLIRALGYVTDMERSSGLARPAASTSTSTASPATNVVTPAATTTQTGSANPAIAVGTSSVAR